MSHLKNNLIKFDPKTGQTVSVQGGANASQTAAMTSSHKANIKQASKLNVMNRLFKGGTVRGKSGAYGPGLGTRDTQELLIKSNAHLSGLKASPDQLTAAAKKPGSGLSAGKTVVIMKGGRRKKTQKKRKRERRAKKHTKRFRRGGQTQKPWGCFSGGRTRSGKKRRKSKRKN